MHLFEIKFQFSATSPFIPVLPHLLQQICRDTITFDVIRTHQPTATSLTVVVNVSVKKETSGVRHEDMHRLGIRDPLHVQANTELQLWLINVARPNSELIQAAWAAYCRQRDMQRTHIPISLLSYSSASGLPPYPKFIGDSTGLEMETMIR